jgi:hypothetical protein
MQWPSADLVAMLEATGEIVTLGVASTRGVVRAADLEQFAENDPVTGVPVPLRIQVDALSVTIRTGSLANLAHGSTVSIRGVSYTVDRIQNVYSGDMTRFLAVAQL